MLRRVGKPPAVRAFPSREPGRKFSEGENIVAVQAVYCCPACFLVFGRVSTARLPSAVINAPPRQGSWFGIFDYRQLSLPRCGCHLPLSVSLGQPRDNHAGSESVVLGACETTDYRIGDAGQGRPSDVPNASVLFVDGHDTSRTLDEPLGALRKAPSPELDGNMARTLASHRSGSRWLGCRTNGCMGQHGKTAVLLEYPASQVRGFVPKLQSKMVIEKCSRNIWRLINQVN